METLSGMSWLLALEEVVRVPVEYDLKHILIVTQNLWANTLENSCIKFIKSGIENNASFDILFNADEADNRNTQQRLLNRFDSKQQQQLRFFPIKRKGFHMQAVTDYIIMNPDSQPLLAYFKVPCTGSEQWIKVDEEAALGLAGRFSKMRDEELAK